MSREHIYETNREFLIELKFKGLENLSKWLELWFLLQKLTTVLEGKVSIVSWFVQMNFDEKIFPIFLLF